MEGTAADGTGPAGGHRSEERPPERPEAPPGSTTAHTEDTGTGSANAGAASGDPGANAGAGKGNDGDPPADPAGENGEAAEIGGEAAQAGKPGGIRTGRNLPAAIAVGVALGAVVLGSLYFVKVLFLIVLLGAVGIGVVEMIAAFAVRAIRVPTAPVLTGFVVMVAGAYWGGPIWLLGAFTLTVLVLLSGRMFKGPDGYVRDAAASVLVSVYPALIAGFVPLMLAKPNGADRVVIFIAVTVCSDIGGYFAGILFGKHKMSIISPKKTWEGFAGSVLACVLCGALLVRFLLDGQYWQGAVLGVVVAVCATLGDLVESVIKRDLGIKDMGNLLPGHGGLMDRLDSLLATLVPVWLLLAIFVPL
ncbi:phosphatidate cytidylyltransferase [Sphaerisporangium perillae]|uniref:phosphatidate cytidylyltransferase n=1 Tax=Sphaerisporangium perillae TaxID=2935860 RepID=UPI00200BCEF7|nr:phosphatidate cytidylyltransferase [Sphaerisporangium perillae]